MRFVDLAVAALAIALSGAVAAGEPASARPGGGGVHTSEQVRAAVEEHIRKEVAASGGVYRLRDERTGTTVELEHVRTAVVSTSALWKVHDPQHRDEGQAFFACTLFRAAGAPSSEKRYDVDMRVEPRDGGLAVTDVRIHRETRLVAGSWIWEARDGSVAAKRR